MMRFVLTLALVAATAPFAMGQTVTSAAQRKALTPQDFDQWRSIEGERLSDDGRWVAYSLMPQVGEGEVVVRATSGSAEFRHSRGYIGRPQTRPNATNRGPAFNAPAAQFFGSHVVFTIEPGQAEVEAARRAKKRPAAQPKSSLGIMRLSDGSVTEVPRVKSFEIPRGDGRFLVYLLHPADSSAAPAGADTAAAGRAAAAPGGVARPIADSAATVRPKKKDYGSTMVIRELNTGNEVRVEDVLAVEVDRDGTWLAYTVSSRVGANDGVYLRRVTGGEPTPVLTGEGHYKQLVFDEGGTRLAFVTDRDDAASEHPRYALYHATVALPAARVLVSRDAFGDAVVLSDRADLEFSDDGARLQFGVAPPALDSIPADSLADKAVFDLWHYEDPRLQPQQQVEAERDRGRSYVAVAEIRGARIRVLGSDSFPQIRFSRDMRTGLAITSLPYAVEAMWGEGGNDVYVIDVATGTRKRMLERSRFGASLSPGARYALYFGEDRHWHAYAIATGKLANLTEKIAGVRFDQETWDTPSDPAPWGVAGWTAGDRSVLLYDRYDIGRLIRRV